MGSDHVLQNAGHGLGDWIAECDRTQGYEDAEQLITSKPRRTAAYAAPGGGRPGLLPHASVAQPVFWVASPLTREP